MPSEPIGQSGKSTSGAGKDGAAPDPDTIVAEIEATREDLAVTLDEIADRVSPKRVAQRGQDRAKVFAETTKELVAEKAAVARTVLTEKAAVAKVAATEKAAITKETLNKKTAAAKDKVGSGSASNASSVAIAGSGASAGASSTTATTAASSTTGTSGTSTTGTPGSLPPTTGVEVPGLVTRPSSGQKAGASSLSSFAAGVPREVAAGGATAVGLLLLVLRRRRRRRGE